MWPTEHRRSCTTRGRLESWEPVDKGDITNDETGDGGVSRNGLVEDDRTSPVELSVKECLQRTRGLV